MSYGAEEKLLHFMIAGGMIFELAIEDWMLRPQPGETPTVMQTLCFGAHEFIGIALLVIVLARFLMMTGERETWLRLFPWLTMAGRKSLARELKEAPSEWLAGKLKATGEQDILAGGVHGLGLLLALALGGSGLIIFIELTPAGTLSAAGNAAMDVHEVLGTLLWVFLIAHIGMAIYHQMLGHRVLQRIFWTEDS